MMIFLVLELQPYQNKKGLMKEKDRVVEDCIYSLGLMKNDALPSPFFNRLIEVFFSIF